LNKNPYSVLGVSENATDEEINDAYKALVKKYHPDKYANSDLADLANEKMSEINVAYDEIKKMRKEGRSYSGSSSSSSGYSSGNAEYASIRALINSRRFSEAFSRLNAVPNSDRGAEWNFLYGVALYGTGRVFDAASYIDRACSMDPSNLEYRGVKDRISSVTFNGNGGDYGRQSSQCSGCDVCSTLLCADCCCECCGGDLIRCC